MHTAVSVAPGLEGSGASWDVCWHEALRLCLPLHRHPHALSRGTAAGRCASAAFSKALAGHRLANIVSQQVFCSWYSCTNCCLVVTIVQAGACGRASKEVHMRKQSTKGSN